MLPADVLLDILKCMNRDGLEKIHETTRVINDIIKRDFSSKPFRLLDDKTWPRIRRDRNKNNVLLLGIHRSNECFVPTIPGWQHCHRHCVQECSRHSYPIDEMRPFLSRYMRFSDVTIHIDEENDSALPPYTPKQIALLESISHIWSGQMLSIVDLSVKTTESLKRMFGSLAILQCRALFHSKIRYVNIGSNLMDIYQSPNLYTLQAIYFSSALTKDGILSLTHYKAEHPQSSTIFVFHPCPLHFDEALEAIKKEFSASSTRCRLRMVIETVVLAQAPLPENLEFRLENSRTKEVLHLKRITKQEAKEKFSVVLYEYSSIFSLPITDGVNGQALILERSGHPRPTPRTSSARPVPIASSHREEAIGVSHARIRGPTGKLAPGPNPGFSGLPEAINPETCKTSSARPVPIALSHREEAIGVSHAPIRGPIRKLALHQNPGFSGLPEAINPETCKTSSARPVPIASSHREEAIGVSHAPIRGPTGKLAPGPNPGFSGLPEAINPETCKTSSARPVPIASSHREEAIGVSHAPIRGPTGKLAPGPNPGFSGLPEAINPETCKTSSARPVPIVLSHREEAIGVSHARIRGPTGKLGRGGDTQSAP
ncbi:hypothetical protein Ddc_11616 [Ditylenchus destructor]|nr:hypothetical protein Ddc_11616 [Ditylenchus destructor]